MRTSYWSRNLLILLFAGSVCAGCDSVPYKYIGSGRILDGDGKPVPAVRVCLFFPSASQVRYPFDDEAALPSWITGDFLEERSVLTNPDGVYTAEFGGSLHFRDSPFSSEPPRLPAVYVYVKAGLEWRQQHIRLGYGAQNVEFRGGRRVNVPDILFLSADKADNLRRFFDMSFSTSPLLDALARRMRRSVHSYKRRLFPPVIFLFPVEALNTHQFLPSQAIKNNIRCVIRN